LKEDSSKNYEAKLEKLKSMEDKRFKAEKDIFDRTIHERDIRIQKLEKEVAYLSTLLTYWKPLD
jgi:AAA+ ATPase superfamily predicted ATPase